MTDTSPISARDARDEQYTVHHNRLDTESLGVAVATAVATFRDVDVTTLEPLHYAINVDALNRLFEPRANGLRNGGSVAFQYNDCLVTVDADGTITVARADAG